MPLPLASLRAVEYHLRDIPADITEHEKQRLIALTAINHLGCLGYVLSHLTASKVHCSHKRSPIKPPDDAEDLDSALFVLGKMQACIADTAFGAVEEMFSALNDPPADTGESEMETTAAHQQGPTTGKLVTYQQRRNRRSGRYERKRQAA